MEKTEPCPSCRTQTPLKKSWTLKRGKGLAKKTYRIFLFKCPKCGRNFRKAKPEEDSIYCGRDTQKLRKPEGKRRKELPRKDMEKVRKPETFPYRKPLRIWVEWICVECDSIHRISFFCSFRSVWQRKKGIRAKWGRPRRKFKLSKVEIEYETSLSELNDFLNSLFSEMFNAKQYVKIYYPKELLIFLLENEKENRALLPKLTHSSKH